MFFIMNNYIENKINSNGNELNISDISNKLNKLNKLNKSTKLNKLNKLNIIDDDIELEKLDNEFNLKYHADYQPKNYGNLWNDDERKIILNYLKKNDNIDDINLYDDKIIQKIARKIERSECGIKEEIKKMIFYDYIENNYTIENLSDKYNINQNKIKILIKMFLEKYGNKYLLPITIENNILKCKIENIKLKKELSELNKLEHK